MFLFNGYLALAIGLIALLIVIFVVSYVLNKKTPLPEGCEDLKITEEGCMACQNTECTVKKKIDFKKIEESIKEEEK